MSPPGWLFALMALFVALHLNFWMWSDARIVGGFPANLLYHIGLCFLFSLAMLLVVTRAWPSQLDD